MSKMTSRLFLCCLCLCKIGSIFGSLNLTAYKEMPSINQLETYDNCLNFDESIEGTYCMVYAEIVPKESSALWQQIDTFSTDRQRHFRHDRLFFGVCVERCKVLLNALTETQTAQLYGGQAIDTELVDYYARVHKRNTDERARYDRLINSCLNYDFQAKYNLTLRTSIEYCEKNDVPLEHDSWDFAVYIIFAVIILINICSTFFDFNLRQKEPLNKQNNTFFKVAFTNSTHSYLTAFSLWRNYYRITQPARSKYAADLKFLNAFRVVGVLAVISLHTAIVFILPIYNPERVEQLYYRALFYVGQNGSVIVQTFFVMSGFLLCVNFSDKRPDDKRKKHCIKLYIKNFLRRYFRLLPTMIILILFNATIMTRMQDGPFWRHLTEAERVFCRELWWKNILLINNFWLKESCSHHTWYVAADMQLFVLFLFIIILKSKYPKVKRYLYALLIVLSFGIPTAITYFRKLNAHVHIYPETYRYLFLKDTQTFYESYMPFYMNMGGYFFGVVSGDIFLAYKKNNSTRIYRGVLRFELFWWTILCGLPALLLSGALFMNENLKRPSIWVALYAGLFRNLWSLFTCLLLLGMCCKLGWLAYEFACVSFFRPLANMSYQAYLWHFTVVRLIAGHYRQLIYFDFLGMFSYVIVIFVITYFVAFVMAILVEYPIGEIVRFFFKDSNPKEEISANAVKSEELLQFEDIRRKQTAGLIT